MGSNRNRVRSRYRDKYEKMLGKLYCTFFTYFFGGIVHNEGHDTDKDSSIQQIPQINRAVHGGCLAVVADDVLEPVLRVGLRRRARHGAVTHAHQPLAHAHVQAAVLRQGQGHQ